MGWTGFPFHPFFWTRAHGARIGRGPQNLLLLSRMNDVNRDLSAAGTAHSAAGRVWRTVRASPRWVVIAGVLLAVALLAWLLKPGAGPRPPGGRFGGGGPMPVVAAPVGSGDMPITLIGLGTVTPLATVTVQSQISGQIMRIAFKEGQTVRAGEPRIPN